MTPFRADLHCHSTLSDGTLTPQELVRYAVEKGLSGLSITDHDTLGAYEMALPLANQMGLELIPGIEFSAVHQGVSIHILGYSFQIDHPALQALCEKQMLRRDQRILLILKKLEELSMPLALEEVISIAGRDHSIGRPHIAQAMVKRGYVESIQDAFNKFLSEGKKAYAAGTSISVEETLEALHHAHGFAVIAHPHLIVHNRTLNRLLEMDFDGLECYYSRFQKEKNQRWIRIAEKKGWLKTGGSDFHGSVKPAIDLGCSWVDQPAFQKMKERMERGVS